MKKILTGSLLLLLTFLIGTSHAVEINIFGPKQYVRTKGKPDVYTDNFQQQCRQMTKSSAH